MSWAEFHGASEVHAIAADEAKLRGDSAAARASFARAAEEEERALACVNASEDPRTAGHTAVSAMALWYHAGEFENARRVGCAALNVPDLPGFARDEIGEMLAAIARERGWWVARLLQRKRWVAAGLAAGVIGAVVTVWICSTGMVTQRKISYETSIGERRSVGLEEGSELELNTSTQVMWRPSKEERRVELLAGQAIFKVHHDDKRPFIVQIGGLEIRDVGTQFDVYRKANGEITVTVIEGGVEVNNRADTQRGEAGQQRPSAAPLARLRAREQADLAAGKLISISTVDTTSVIAWRDGFVTAPESGMQLGDLVSELARYTAHEIVIKDPHLKSIQVGGQYRTDNVRRALEILASRGAFQLEDRGDAYVLFKTSPQTPPNTPPPADPQAD